MADENMMTLAGQVYQTLCDAIDHRNWKYQKEEDKLAVFFGVSGHDLPMRMVLVVDPKRQLIRLMSPMPFKFDEDKRVDGAIATCAASYKLAEGNFDYDIATGQVTFRMVASFRESLIGEGLFQHMINYSCTAVDAYNDKFLAVNEGSMDIWDFVAGTN